MDKRIWGDPEIFRPERFLDAEGKVFIPEQYTPFGFGKQFPFYKDNDIATFTKLRKQDMVTVIEM